MKIYIVLSQSGSMLSKCMKMITRDKYNHVSLSLDPNLKKMYSFARRRAARPFPAGFVVEGKDIGSFARFTDAEVRVYEMNVTDQQYINIKRQIYQFIHDYTDLKYNYLGLFYALINRDKMRKNRFYCSQFVKRVLVEAGVLNAYKYKKAMRPMDFCQIENSTCIFEGRMRDYQVESKNDKNTIHI